MLTKISKWILFFVSYIPLFFISAFNSILLYSKSEKLDFYEGIKEFFVYFEIDYFHASFLAYIIIIVVSYMFLKLVISLQRKTIEKINVKSIKCDNSEIANYFITYLVPLFSLNENIGGLIIFIMIFIVIGMVYVNNNMLSINPTLFLMGYRIYSVKDEYDNEKTLISKKEEADLQGNEITASKLSKGIFINIS